MNQFNQNLNKFNKKNVYKGTTSQFQIADVNEPVDGY